MPYMLQRFFTSYLSVVVNLLSVILNRIAFIKIWPKRHITHVIKLVIPQTMHNNAAGKMYVGIILFEKTSTSLNSLQHLHIYTKKKEIKLKSGSSTYLQYFIFA